MAETDSETAKIPDPPPPPEIQSPGSPPTDITSAPAPARPEKKPARASRVVGEFNFLEASIGARGSGKSTHQCERAFDLSREVGGAYVIGHSLGQRLPEKLANGRRLPIRYWKSIEELDRGLRKHPGDWHILAPPLREEGGDPDRDTADDLLRYSIRLSTALRKAAWKKKHPFQFWKPTVRTLGLESPPIIVIVDEGIAVDGASTNRREADKWFLEYIYSLRHLHVALFYAIQESTARSWRILEAATAIHVFRQKHQWSIQAVQAAGATDEQLDRIRALGPFEKVTLT